jgi:CheY-like chemotaxis protein
MHNIDRATFGDLQAAAAPLDSGQVDTDTPTASGPPCKVLVAEDQYVIALDLSEALERCGVEVLGPVATLDAAMCLLARHEDIAGALLDITMQGSTIYPVADALRRRRVPFVFATGRQPEAIAPAFRDAAYCQKPMSSQKIVEVLLREIAQAGGTCAAADMLSGSATTM